MDIDASQKGRWSFPEDRIFDLNVPASYPDQFSGAVGFAEWSQPSWNYNLFAQDTWHVTSDFNDVYLNQTLLAERRMPFTANSPTENPFCTTGVVTTACRNELRAFLAQSYPAFPPLQGALLREFFNGLSADFRIP
jgi:hypothetical protein